MVLSGAQTFIKAAFEDADVWGEAATAMTVPNSTEFTFGQGVDFTISRNNNKSRVYGTGARNAQETVALQYSSNVSINGTLSNVYWLLGVLGANADAGSVGAYTHTYTEADVVPTFTAWARSSFTTPKNELLRGVVIDKLTLSTAVNEPVSFSLDCMCRYDSLNEDSESAVTEIEKIFTFAGGVLQTPTGTTIANIQNIGLTITNNAELVYQTGSRFANAYVVKNREYGFKMTVAVSDYTLLSRLYDGTTTSTAPGTGNGEIASLTLTFTNSNSDTIVFTFTGVHFNEDSNPRSANEVIKQDITGWCNALTNCVYTNDVETAPAAATNVD
ncbi:hypothetical protein K9M79_03080 [Candidatus Woesearchaeota archaeon]|nr:hypothetical protein [Candidatus Woesearchaeota archaeon]